MTDIEECQVSELSEMDDVLCRRVRQLSKTAVLASGTRDRIVSMIGEARPMTSATVETAPAILHAS